MWAQPELEAAFAFVNLDSQPHFKELRGQGFCRNRGTRGQKLLRQEMNASNAVRLALYGYPVDGSVAVKSPNEQWLKKGIIFPSWQESGDR